jgi:hypothetical protein
VIGLCASVAVARPQLVLDSSAVDPRVHFVPKVHDAIPHSHGAPPDNLGFFGEVYAHPHSGSSAIKSCH